MTNLDIILKIRNITLLTKVCLVKAIVFPVVMYGCESWTIKKAECQRIETFELWCWRRLLRVPWTARRSILNELNQSVLFQESSPALTSPVTLSLVSDFPIACLYLSLYLPLSASVSLSVSLCVGVCVCECINRFLVSCKVVSSSFATSWTVAHQATLFMEFHNQEY